MCAFPLTQLTSPRGDCAVPCDTGSSQTERKNALHLLRSMERTVQGNLWL